MKIFSHYLHEVNDACARQGITTGAISAEYAPGQFEINLRHSDQPLQAADQCVMFRRAVQCVARKHGLQATFMAKPYADNAGSGLHLHLSLLDHNGKNIFDGGGEYGAAGCASPLLRHAIGGLSQSMAESMAIFAPNINSYRRFVADSYVPMRPNWGYENRSVAIRVPKSPGSARRLEHRVAVADANPYLTLAALLASVHHGLSNDIDAGKPARGNAGRQPHPEVPFEPKSAFEKCRHGRVLPGYFGQRYLDAYSSCKLNEYRAFVEKWPGRKWPGRNQLVSVNPYGGISMTRDPRYDILFEPVQIGPVTSRNRFYQVPHCNGMGHVYPHGEACQRGLKAEGGWGVVSTQEVEIHPSSEWSPYIEGRLWDDGDMKRLGLMVDAVHRHDSLAAIEITHNGHASANLYSRLPAMGVSAMMFDTDEPAQAFAMTRRDIANVRRWHRKAALRARDIGFDIVYVYAAHDLALPFHFISRRRNQRTDEYGGSLENRVRFLRELLDDTKDAVGDRCGIAVRFAVDELAGEDSVSVQNEGREVVEMLAELPDLWDVNISDWANDSISARFGEEGGQEKYTAFVKQVTGKPVVGVGRFTSPDTMVSQIKRGVLDMIGAARPSIADPFLPHKIETGRVEDIRECIGCNICVSGDMTVRPIRCTQNPTMGEEYRRDWHPEKIDPASGDSSILIVGGGPAGLEAAMSLGRRGYRVTLAEAAAQAGRPGSE